MHTQPATVATFKYKEIAPIGSKFVHASMRRAFCSFLFNDNYRIDGEKIDFGLLMMNVPVHITSQKKGAGNLVFHRLGRPSLLINVNGEMCAVAQQRYAVFLKMYMKHGKQFIDNLNEQIKFVPNAAA